MDNAGDNTPDLQLLTILQFDGGVVRILGQQFYLSGTLVQAFDGELAVDDGDHDGAMHGIQGTVDYQEIVVLDAGANHGVALGTHEEGGFAVRNQVFVEIEGVADVVVGRTREAGLHGMGEERQQDRGNGFLRGAKAQGISGHGSG